MINVFVGGSRALRPLPSEVEGYLDAFIERGAHFLVGDAAGVDADVQRFLAVRDYTRVTVYFSGDAPRYHVRSYPAKQVDPPAGSTRKDRRYFTAKDRAMALDATVGLMVWDGRSVGTALNIHRLIQLGKGCVLWHNPVQRVVPVASLNEWRWFLATLPAHLAEQVERDDGLPPLHPAADDGLPPLIEKI